VNWLRRLLGSDRTSSEIPDDSDHAVLAGTVPLWQAPLIIDGLAERDIKATYAETSGRRGVILGGLPSARVYVIDRDRAAAADFIAEMIDPDQAPPD
jgi:hypothetical protein